MPYKVVGKNVYVLRGGKWLVKQKCKSAANAVKAVRLLRGVKGRKGRQRKA